MHSSGCSVSLPPQGERVHPQNAEDAEGGQGPGCQGHGCEDIIEDELMCMIYKQSISILYDSEWYNHFFPPFLAFLAYACFSATIPGFFSASSSIYLNCFITSSSIPSTLSFSIYSLIFFIYSIYQPAISPLIF